MADVINHAGEGEDEHWRAGGCEEIDRSRLYVRAPNRQSDFAASGLAIGIYRLYPNRRDGVPRDAVP